MSTVSGRWPWWYENPAPNFDPKTPWKKQFIKKGGGKAHHDQAIADFKGAGKPQLMFWNQGARKLFMAEIPDNPRAAGSWPLTEILDTSKVQTAVKQEGMAVFDVDGDGKLDIISKPYCWDTPRLDIWLNLGNLPAAAGSAGKFERLAPGAEKQSP